MSLTFTPSENSQSWSDGSWLFPKAVRLLEIPQYREPILSGFILSLSSKTESTVRRQCLAFFLQS